MSKGNNAVINFLNSAYVSLWAISISSTTTGLTALMPGSSCSAWGLPEVQPSCGQPNQPNMRQDFNIVSKIIISLWKKPHNNQSNRICSVTSWPLSACTMSCWNFPQRFWFLSGTQIWLFWWPVSSMGRMPRRFAGLPSQWLEAVWVHSLSTVNKPVWADRKTRNVVSWC